MTTDLFPPELMLPPDVELSYACEQIRRAIDLADGDDELVEILESIRLSVCSVAANRQQPWPVVVP